MFTNLSIRTRLGIAFCAVLLLMAACVLTGVWGLNDMFGSAQHAVSNDVQLAQRTARIDVLVLNERRHEKDIFINLADEAKKKDYQKNWDDDLEALKSEINAVHALELSDEDHRAIEDMRSQVEAYAAGLLGVFAKVQAAEIKNTQDANAAMSVHKEAIHALEATSEKVNAHAIAKVNGIVASLSTTRVTTRNVMLGLGAACLVLGVMLCLAIIRSITRPLRRAMEVAQAIAGGKLDNHIAANARDETGSLLKALGAMQDSLLHSKLNCEGQLESIGALQAVIEFTPHGVIETANQNFLNTMGYTLEQLRGKHHSLFMDPVERDGADCRAFWEQLRRGKAQAGQFRRVDRSGNDVWLQGIYSPILSVDGLPFKVVKYATDVTAERRAAQMNAAFKGALNKLSSSVVVADNDLRIIYLNEASQSLMAACQADFRKDLPLFDAARLVGNSVDVLYVEPVSQRNLLAQLRGTSASEQQIGGRTMRLVANPMNDESGRRLGTVVEWVDRTPDVKIESEVQDMVAAVTDGQLTRRISLEGKDGAYLNLSGGLNVLVEPVASVVDNVRQLVEAANAGDLTQRIPTDGVPGLQLKIGGGINDLVDNMAGVISKVKGTSEEVNRGAAEISQGNTNLSQRTEEQASSPGGDRLLDGADHLHGQAERRQCPPGQPAGGRRARPGREGRRGGRPGRARDGRDQRGLQEDRRHHRRDRRDRLPDQPSGAQRGGRGRPRRRAGPRLRGRGHRGRNLAGRSRRRRQGDQGPDPGSACARSTRARDW